MHVACALHGATLLVFACRYPKIVRDVIEDHPEWLNGVEVPVDTSTPNPNGMEFDNLYLVRVFGGLDQVFCTHGAQQRAAFVKTAQQASCMLGLGPLDQHATLQGRM